MKSLIAAALILSANSAFAAGFSPWSEIAAPVEQASYASTAVTPAGFAPWRERVIVDEIQIRTDRDIAISARPSNVFRPWS
jgi:hypothetical protein